MSKYVDRATFGLLYTHYLLGVASNSDNISYKQIRKTETLVHQNFANSGASNTLIVMSEEKKPQAVLLACVLYNAAARESRQEVG